MDNMYKKNDRRVIRTKKTILAAFSKLIARKNLDEITIKDIADEAEVNRRTVYNHYKGIYQIMDDIENDIVSDFDAALNDVDFNRIMENPDIIFTKLNTIINSNMELYRKLSQKNVNSNLSLKIISKLKEKIKASFNSQIPLEDPNNTLMFDYTISGVLTVYHNWLITDRRQPIEELSKMVRILCFSGVNGVLNAPPEELKEHL